MSPSGPVDEASPQGLRRAILALAVPAFLTLVAEPLFLLADSAIIGHLGTLQLAGLGVASAALVSASALFVFLAYGTTALVSRTVGAAGVRQAISAGLDGLWLAALLGALAAVAVLVWAEPICALFGASPGASAYATTYLRISALGLPAMLLALASTGILRGLQDTRTPLAVTTCGFVANIVLNVWLVYGVGLGLAGSAWGTVSAQWAMALALLAVVARGARRVRAPLLPHLEGIMRAALDGLPLLVRTVALRAVFLLTTWAAAGLGDVPLAAYQVSATVWTFLAFSLDGLAIAGQALTGRALGAGRVDEARALTATMARWGIVLGFGFGALLLLLHDVLPMLFTTDPAVRSALSAALFVVALGQPIAGLAFVLDGVLIGAGDARWLAGAQVALLAAYLPVLLATRALLPEVSIGELGPQEAAVGGLWVAFLVFMTLRALLLRHRSRTDAWLVVGLT